MLRKREFRISRSRGLRTVNRVSRYVPSEIHEGTALDLDYRNRAVVRIYGGWTGDAPTRIFTAKTAIQPGGVLHGYKIDVDCFHLDSSRMDRSTVPCYSSWLRNARSSSKPRIQKVFAPSALKFTTREKFARNVSRFREFSPRIQLVAVGTGWEEKMEN